MLTLSLLKDSIEIDLDSLNFGSFAFFLNITSNHVHWIMILYPYTTTRNMLIYDEFFVMFLKNITMTHHLWRFPYFRHGFEVLGSRPKNQWRFINFITIRPTIKWRFNKFVTINKLKITIVFLTYQVYGTKFLYTEIFYKIEIAKKIELATCKIRCIYN